MLFGDPTVFAKSYHFRTVIQLSRCARENIPQGVTFKTPIFVRFFKTFFKKLNFCSIAQKHPALGRHLESLKKRLFLKLFSDFTNFVGLHKHLNFYLFSFLPLTYVRVSEGQKFSCFENFFIFV